MLSKTYFCKTSSSKLIGIKNNQIINNNHVYMSLIDLKYSQLGIRRSISRDF